MTRAASVASGASLLTSLAVLRATGGATSETAIFAGRALWWTCPFKLCFGFDCPGCGMTRSVMLTLGGRFDEAFAFNPGGPLFVLGVFLAGLALILLPFMIPDGDSSTLAAALKRLRTGAAIYGLSAAAVVLVRWTFLQV